MIKLTLQQFNNLYNNNKTGKNIIVKVDNFPLLGDKLKTFVKGPAWRNSYHKVLIPVYGLNSSVPIENITIIDNRQ